MNLEIIKFPGEKKSFLPSNSVMQGTFKSMGNHIHQFLENHAFPTLENKEFF